MPTTPTADALVPSFHPQVTPVFRDVGGRTSGCMLLTVQPPSHAVRRAAAMRFHQAKKAQSEMASLCGMFFMQLRVRSRFVEAPPDSVWFAAVLVAGSGCACTLTVSLTR